MYDLYLFAFFCSGHYVLLCKKPWSKCTQLYLIGHICITLSAYATIGIFRNELFALTTWPIAMIEYDSVDHVVKSHKQRLTVDFVWVFE